MRANFRKFVTLVAVTGVLGLVLLSSDRYLPDVPHQPERLPAAVVTLGDSTLSGEGIGRYEPGTNGENGNWCHRSPAATVHNLGLRPTVSTINLACSGAQAEHVSADPDRPFSEGSQAHQLAEIAEDYRINDVIVQVGANDDPGFAYTVNRCAEAWASRSPEGCAKEMRSDWPDRVDRMIPKVVTALRDVRAVMDRAGYLPSSYSLVVQSYAAPVGPDLNSELQNLSGCPFRSSDLTWIHETGVPQLSEGLREAADEVGARFLDLSRAGHGHEACTGKKESNEGEWFTRFSVDWESLQDEREAEHAMQESFHANAAGHAQFGRCLGQFLGTEARRAVCLPDKLGNLEAVPSDVAAQRSTP